MDYYTENLADFGFREIKMLHDILDARVQRGLPPTFENSGVKPALNRNSGYVFLVNEDCQTAMLNPETDKLEVFHSTPYHGHEGFLTDLLEELTPADIDPDDEEYPRDAAEAEGVTLPDAWQQQEECA